MWFFLTLAIAGNAFLLWGWQRHSKRQWHTISDLTIRLANARADAQLSGQALHRLQARVRQCFPDASGVTLARWALTLHARSTAAGFWPPTHAQTDQWISQQIALIHSELSEALEALRDGKRDVWYGPDGKPEGFPTEIADAVIRLLDLCEGLGIDLEAVMRVKHRYNCTRPAKHGRAF